MLTTNSCKTSKELVIHIVYLAKSDYQLNKWIYFSV